mgnify:CR=1 FL=1
MPSKTLKQHNLMEMVAHNPAKAKELKIPQSVGKEFVAADKGKKFKGGGMVEKESKAEERKEMSEDKKQDVALNLPLTLHQAGLCQMEATIETSKKQAKPP